MPLFWSWKYLLNLGASIAASELAQPFLLQDCVSSSFPSSFLGSSSLEELPAQPLSLMDSHSLNGWWCQSATQYWASLSVTLGLPEWSAAPAPTSSWAAAHFLAIVTLPPSSTALWKDGHHRTSHHIIQTLKLDLRLVLVLGTTFLFLKCPPYLSLMLYQFLFCPLRFSFFLLPHPGFSNLSFFWVISLPSYTKTVIVPWVHFYFFRLSFKAPPSHPQGLEWSRYWSRWWKAWRRVCCVVDGASVEVAIGSEEGGTQPC